MAHLTQINTKDEYTLCVKHTAGKTVLLAYWPEDELSNEVVRALVSHVPDTQAPPSSAFRS